MARTRSTRSRRNTHYHQQRRYTGGLSQSRSWQGRLSTAPETHRLTLEGDSIAYSNLWSPLLEQTARTVARKSEIHITTPFPRYADQPVDIDIITTATTTPTLQADSIDIPLAEDLTIDDVFHATTWTSTTGWHTLTLPNDSTEQAYYISAPNEWSALAATQATNNTKAHASAAGKSGQVTTEFIPVPPLIFYLLLVLAAGFLWLAPKL